MASPKIEKTTDKLSSDEYRKLLQRLVTFQERATIANLIVFVAIGTTSCFLLAHGNTYWKDDLEKWGKALEIMDIDPGTINILKSTKELLENDINMQCRTCCLLLIAIVLALIHFLLLVLNWKKEWTRSTLFYTVYLTLGVAIVATSFSSVGVAEVKMELLSQKNPSHCNSIKQQQPLALPLSSQNIKPLTNSSAAEFFFLNDILGTFEMPNKNGSKEEYEYDERADLALKNNCQVERAPSFIPTFSMAAGIDLLLLAAIFFVFSNAYSLAMSARFWNEAQPSTSSV